MDKELEINIKKNNEIVQELKGLFPDSVIMKQENGFEDFYLKSKSGDQLSIAIDLSTYPGDSEIGYFMVILDEVENLNDYDSDNIVYQEFTYEFEDCISWLNDCFNNIEKV